ncbi:exodeoxyribonuclease VII large subunit [Serpentinicella sp. ANB-PHB4]|uniref:exodeoxyribonuclease VII large subunit n=1 Tax=Serpentinicella sp. ANB-PHB4 TaxID=3074076 RepID=UPI002863706E|nr:exodeoxyribonuclease VII large subunit [Serpentinicella sp. ANB-PHB4]MDR5658189.1 exodeoxyribonuclease VII large subunit [Serpentinicella sp. ANB-PHB4]
MNIKTLSVSQANDYIKRLLVSDPILHNIKIEGELSNVKYHHSGHIYFTLKDKQSKINCIMFKSYTEKLDIQIKNGMAVIIRGYISVYERDGQYQLYASEIEEKGLGDLYKAYTQLKERLEKEGFFDISYKKDLPFRPRKIGVVTSLTGAVIRDIITVTLRRFPKVQLSIYPVPVQGEGSAESITKAINKINKSKLDIDVIIIARGGGSIEELWSFNEELVAKAIFNSKIPIISAVGHETDFTIADFVADIRANTPSTAAELAVPSYKEQQAYIDGIHKRLISKMNERMNVHRKNLDYIKNNQYFRHPFDRVFSEQQYVDQIGKDLNKLMDYFFSTKKNKLLSQAKRLDSLNPLSILTRGYAVVYDKNEKAVNSVKNIQIDENLFVNFLDGYAKCTVNELIREDKALDEENGLRKITESIRKSN